MEDVCASEGSARPSYATQDPFENLIMLQSIPGVPALHQGGSALAANPADWMLQISEPESEDTIGVDFADVFSQSSAYRYC